MYKLIVLSFLIATIYAAPGYNFHGFGPIIAPPPVFHAPIVKAPVIAPAPIFHAPVAPVIKTIAPATSYATVTKVHVIHPAPIVKTILAPQPILKSYYPAPIPFGHGYH